jgi:hypothetical protein
LLIYSVALFTPASPTTVALRPRPATAGAHESRGDHSIWIIGTHSGVFRTPTGEVPATGRHVEFRWMSAYEARGDELASEHLFFDQVELLTQLGL